MHVLICVYIMYYVVTHIMILDVGLSLIYIFLLPQGSSARQ